MNPMLPDDPEGKVSTCAENVFRIWEETKEKRSAQLIFSDLSTPKAADRETGERAFNVYDDMREKLIAKGIPENEIAFIHDADCPWRPADLEQRAGRIVRFGNKNAEVQIFRYTTSGTFDSYLWQTVHKEAGVHRADYEQQIARALLRGRGRNRAFLRRDSAPIRTTI
jgi:hypothetical protein